MLRTACVVSLTAVIVACSGGDEPVTDPSAVTTAVAAVSTAPESVRDAGDVRPSTTPPAEPVVWTVAIDVSVDGFYSEPSLDAATTLEFDPAASGDPFGVSASCSGLRAEVAAYTVYVSGGADVDYVGLWTSSPLALPGIYDVQIRVEHAGSVYDAIGTMTLGADLRSAEFVGFGSNGGEIEGRFRCDGVDAAPSPLVLGANDGVADSIEVFALLRYRGAIRIVDLATTEMTLASCPDAEAARSEVIGVRGGPGLGSISSLEATADGVSMRVGSVDYEFTGEPFLDGGVAGTLGGRTIDGIELEAAYRCS